MSRFGTDGIRELAGRGALAPDQVLLLGRILGTTAPSVLVGRDTRASGPAIESALARGLSEQGARVTLAGVLPTPGVAFGVRRGGYALGVVVSASHNPAEYNGIKLFDRRGLKLSTAAEARIESRMDDGGPFRLPRTPGKVRRSASVLAAYERHVRGQLPRGLLKGWRIAADTAHGAASGILQRCLNHWGAKVVSLGHAPDGDNINAGVGATAPEGLRRHVLASRCDLGIALDGDADRAVFVDEEGRVQDGDAVLYVLAADLAGRGVWRPKVLVATVASNLGLDRAVASLGGKVVRTPVGDRHVSERMRAGRFPLGGESSGHLILPGSGGTGDGLLAAARILGILKRTGRPLSELAAGMQPFPQVTRNVRVTRKPPIASVRPLARAVAAGARRLGKEGRLLVRYSGTEPLLRILAEGPDRKVLEGIVAEVASLAEGIA